MTFDDDVCVVYVCVCVTVCCMNTNIYIYWHDSVVDTTARHDDAPISIGDHDGVISLREPE